MSTETTPDPVELITSQAIEDLLDTAEIVMVDRRNAMFNDNPDPEFLARTIALHDRLVAMAREMNDYFGTRTPASTGVAWEHPDAPAQDRQVRIATAIQTAMPEEWSISDLAKSAGVNKGTVDRILNGKTTNPQARTLRKIEQALGLEEGTLG